MGKHVKQFQKDIIRDHVKLGHNFKQIKKALDLLKINIVDSTLYRHIKKFTDKQVNFTQLIHLLVF